MRVVCSGSGRIAQPAANKAHEKDKMTFTTPPSADCETKQYTKSGKSRANDNGLDGLLPLAAVTSLVATQEAAELFRDLAPLRVKNGSAPACTACPLYPSKADIPGTA